MEDFEGFTAITLDFTITLLLEASKGKRWRLIQMRE